MSERYPGGIISQTAPVPSGPYQNSTAPGVWTMEQAAYWQQQGNWPTAGNVNPSAFIENLFQTYLYTGNGSSQTITNGIDLAGQGGMVWTKPRNTTGEHELWDTARGVGNYLVSNTTAANVNLPGIGFSGYGLTAFNANGFSLGLNWNGENGNGNNLCSWTFRKQPKFFDVVTGTGGATFNHSLGVTPGMIMIKLTNGTSDWWTVHRSSNGYFRLNLTNAAASTGTPGIASTGAWVNASSTTFSTSNFVSSGESFVAYLFAHNAGGFGLTGTDNVISCGSVNTSSAGSVNLGYEPQWLLLKGADAASNWFLVDNMRGLVSGVNDNSAFLYPNTSGAEVSTSGFAINSTGFSWAALGYTNLIYMAIRRGPMATPTLGTSVFYPTTYTETVAQGTAYTGGFPVDSLFTKTRNAAFSAIVYDRLRGTTTSDNNILFTALTDAETDYGASTWSFANNTGVNIGSLSNNTPGRTNVIYQFRRAPGFFDEVCYTGAGATSYPHNLGVVPELMIVKCRNDVVGWAVYSATLGATKYLRLQTTDAAISDSGPFGTAPTSTVFYGGGDFPTSYSGYTYVAYLFATVSGVSKVGSYTGTGSTQTINAGLPTGARFVFIKRTDSTGDWWVWDTARGMVAGTDPRFAFNAQTTETNNDWVYTTTNGFQIVTSDATVNASGGSYIYLAIA